MSQFRSDWGGVLLGEFSVGQNDFEAAFYIATQELKKRARLANADAVICMRQDIDLDTNGFQYFYLQMYGTAVRFVNKREAMQRQMAEEEAYQREEAAKVEAARAEEAKIEAVQNAVRSSGSQMNALFDALLACEKYAELLALWKNSGLMEKEEFAEYTQQVKNKAEVERLYGSDKTRVKQFIENMIAQMRGNN